MAKRILAVVAAMCALVITFGSTQLNKQAHVDQPQTSNILSSMEPVTYVITIQPDHEDNYVYTYVVRVDPRLSYEL